MKFAVVKTGGKQYRVAEGDVLTIGKLPESVGEKAMFTEVLLLNDGEQTTIGKPFIPGTSVSAEVMSTGKGKKVVIVKYKPKVRYRVKRGHRQFFTKVKITTIDWPKRS